MCTIFLYLDTITKCKPQTNDEPRGLKTRGNGPKGPKPPTNLYGGPIHGATKILNTNDLSYTITQQMFEKSQTLAFHAQKWVQEECSHSVAELHCSDNEDTMDNWQEDCTTLIDHFLHSPESHRITTEDVAGNEPTTTKVAHYVQSMDAVPNPTKLTSARLTGACGLSTCSQWLMTITSTPELRKGTRSVPSFAPTQKYHTHGCLCILMPSNALSANPTPMVPTAAHILRWIHGVALDFKFGM